MKGGKRPKRMMVVAAGCNRMLGGLNLNVGAEAGIGPATMLSAHTTLDSSAPFLSVQIALAPGAPGKICVFGQVAGGWKTPG